MKTITKHLRNGLHQRLGIHDTAHVYESISEMKAEIRGKIEALEEMVEFAKNRLLMGAIRYGKSDEALQSREDLYAATNKRMRMKLKAYEDTGNAEMLVDLMNYCAIEYRNKSHPNYHFKAMDDN